MRVVLAYSGGLDTSWCVAHLAGRQGAEVVTVTVDTGGRGRGELDRIAARARELGAARHVEIDARQATWERWISVLVRGNVLRGEVYPLSVAAERTQQAIEVARVARETGADAVAHGSTGAGNDQVRFDVAFRVLTDLPVLAPVREAGLTREQARADLRRAGFEPPPDADRYSVNRGLWGTTIGGDWTHDPWTPPPPDAWGEEAPVPPPADLVIGWKEGLPVSLDGEPLEGPDLVEALDARLAPYRVGRGIHVGETVLGIRGRIGFAAPAAIVLVHAHRELEKLVLSPWQAFWKDHLARFWGRRLHEGQAFDPVMEDIASLVRSSQRHVEGETRVRVAEERFQVTGARSPYSLFDPSVAVYGERHELWTGADAEAFTRLSALPALLAARRAR